MNKLCKKCNTIRNISEFSKDKSKPSGLSYTCKHCRKAYQDGYHKGYYQNNKEAKAIYAKNKRNTDGIYKLKGNIRKLIGNSLLNKGYKKNTKTVKILGCSLDDFINHLQSQFVNGMTLDNYGEWVIDHIIPLAAASTEDEIIKLNHYTNLQPLWQYENRDKWHKLDWKRPDHPQ